MLCCLFSKHYWSQLSSSVKFYVTVRSQNRTFFRLILFSPFIHLDTYRRSIVATHFSIIRVARAAKTLTLLDAVKHVYDNIRLIGYR